MLNSCENVLNLFEILQNKVASKYSSNNYYLIFGLTYQESLLAILQQFG